VTRRLKLHSRPTFVTLHILPFSCATTSLSSDAQGFRQRTIRASRSCMFQSRAVFFEAWFVRFGLLSRRGFTGFALFLHRQRTGFFFFSVETPATEATSLGAGPGARATLVAHKHADSYKLPLAVSFVQRLLPHPALAPYETGTASRHGRSVR